MAEEFQSRVCGGNWWMNSSKISPFMGSGLSPCSALMSTTTGDHLDYMGMITNYGPSSWQMMTDQLKPIRSSCNYKDQNSTTSTAADNSDSGGSSSILMDSSLPLIGFGLSSSSSSSSDWNQALLSGDGRGGESYNSSGLQEIQEDWSPEDQDSITINNNNFKLGMSNMQDFSNLDHQQAAAAATGGHGLIMNCSSTTATNSTSPPHSYGYSTTTTTTSSLIQSFFDPDPPEPSQQQPIFNNNNNNNNHFAVNNNLNNDHFSHSPTTTTTCFLNLQQQQQQQYSLQFSNNTPFWKASPATTETNDMTIRTNNFLLPTSQPQFLGSSFDEKPNVPNLTTTQKRPNNQELRDSGSLAKKGSEPAFKRPRIETPSPLPTFKVRKEKLGDRITALQQLVSPFGKTDTASVLHEAIEYIKYLHDQVSVLSTPYMKNNGNPIQHQQQGSSSDERLSKEEARQDLKSRGLCLVPISSTFPVANETPADFWTPTFGVGSTFG